MKIQIKSVIFCSFFHYASKDIANKVDRSERNSKVSFFRFHVRPSNDKSYRRFYVSVCRWKSIHFRKFENMTILFGITIMWDVSVILITKLLLLFLRDSSSLRKVCSVRDLVHSRISERFSEDTAIDFEGLAKLRKSPCIV